VALLLGVRPTMKNAPRWLYRRAWKLHNAVLPLLHSNDVTIENKNALKVLWCKALASVDPKSSCWNDWTYDMMPDHTRWWVLKAVPTWFYPRLHHANVEFRTVYLNRAIQQELVRLPRSTRVRLVAVGGGYDVRCTRLLSTRYIQQAWEWDLPVVMDAKRRLLERLQQRRGKEVQLPNLRSVDLNDLEQVEVALDEMFSDEDDGPTTPWHTIFVAEGVLMFLEDGIPMALLQLLKRTVLAHGQTASFCFADCLVQSDDSTFERQLVQEFLLSSGWGTFVDWSVKPGRARQMGCARIG